MDVASSLSDDHYITFNVPVQLPRVTLPPGTYLFVSAGTNVVRVMSADRSHTFATFFTVPSTRSAKRGGDVRFQQIRFDVGANGQPVRIIGLYPQGSWEGVQPLYPKYQRTPKNLVARQ